VATIQPTATEPPAALTSSAMVFIGRGGSGVTVTGLGGASSGCSTCSGFSRKMNHTTPPMMPPSTSTISTHAHHGQ
jgi:hypothetical protein